VGRSGDLSRLRNCWPGDLVEIVQWGAPEAGAFFAVCDDEPWDTNGYLRHHNGGFVVQLGEVCLIIERAQSGWGYKAAAPEGRVGWIRREQCHKLKKRKVKE
jgi:hypothetical protein